VTQLSRREFAALAASAAVAPLVLSQRPALAASSLTAQEVIDRVRKNAGAEWKSDTVDTLKAGEPGTVVTGIATASMATLDVLKRAVRANANLIVTFEPTFFSRADSQTLPPARGQAVAAPDPILAAKVDFIQKNRLVIWRFSDHWRLRKPDPLAQGLSDAFGWRKYQVAGDPSRYDIPAVTLDILAADLKRKLNARGGVRVIGNRETRVARVALLPSSTPLTSALQALPAVDAIIAGEVREWESVVYAQDAVFAGQKKGLILIGRVLSEEQSMNLCATWVKTLVPEVPTRWVPVGDPYWRPV